MEQNLSASPCSSDGLAAARPLVPGLQRVAAQFLVLPLADADSASDRPLPAALLVVRSSSLSAPPCGCYLCRDQPRSILGVHTALSAVGRPLKGASLWAKLAPTFEALPPQYIQEHRWCIEPWSSERSALAAWPSAALRYGHLDLNPPRHLWLGDPALSAPRPASAAAAATTAAAATSAPPLPAPPLSDAARAGLA